MFKDMIGKTVEVYIDDMVVKSKQKVSHVLDLKRAFERLRQYGMKLNPAKCSFGLLSGKFLGYMMTQRGIEANPEKTRAVLEMSSPRNKAGRFGWNDDCEHALNEIKRYLTSPPILMSPKTGQTICIYLAASEYAVSAVLFVREPEEKPVYFVSKSLTDAETRLATWETYLGAYTIDYEPRTAEKGHAIASLVVDFLVDDIAVYESVHEEEVLHETENVLPIPLPWEHMNVSKKSSKTIDMQIGSKESIMIPESDSGIWKIYTDGSANTDGAGIGRVLVSPEGIRVENAIRLEFTASNNQDVRGCENGSTSSEVQHDPMEIDEVSNDQSEDWRQPYVRYLQMQELPQDKNQAGKITITAWRYALIEGDLYKNPVSMEPYLRCVTQELGKQLLAEAHEGCCRNHSGGRSLAHKLLSQGYFWPYMKNDAKEYTKKMYGMSFAWSSNKETGE
ncbi:uncharacterized protein LOC113272892 [Papaver somniferum]|uniref:uncharacterized protein LOC113272892 n=1 Tax=Papaver somniferum TaxID=3469 RepID=UPI000E6F5436|nr:uncharacterized protein LOC113272892 [Papaver somniferum]